MLSLLLGKSVKVDMGVYVACAHSRLRSSALVQCDQQSYSDSAGPTNASRAALPNLAISREPEGQRGNGYLFETGERAPQSDVHCLA